MEHSRYFFFLANGSGAMNSCCRELLSPQTVIAALTLTVMQGFKAKKDWFMYIRPFSVYSAYSTNLHSCTSGGSRTRVWLLGVLTVTLRSLHPSLDKMSYLNQMYEKGNVSIHKEKKYRECCIRQVTSFWKILLFRGSSTPIYTFSEWGQISSTAISWKVHVLETWFRFQKMQNVWFPIQL